VCGAVALASSSQVGNNCYLDFERGTELRVHAHSCCRSCSFALIVFWLGGEHVVNGRHGLLCTVCEELVT
jgi:hypothetical protein